MTNSKEQMENDAEFVNGFVNQYIWMIYMQDRNIEEVELVVN